jgi:radical SAM superfamily enzyme YgiQ (UPF0313 family)
VKTTGDLIQLGLFTPKRAKRACFFSLHPKSKPGKFSAYAPKAMRHFAEKYDLPIVERPEDLAAFDVVFWSLHCFRDFYLVARVAHHKREGQEWIAGGNACATPTGIAWIMDYVYIGDCRASFGRLLAGERDMPGLLDTRHADRTIAYVDEDLDPTPINPGLMEMQKGCPRRCLFCIHPWRHRTQHAPQEAVEEFVRTFPKRSLGLMANSTDDVPYYAAISAQLAAAKKQNMTVSFAVQSFTEDMAKERRADMLFGAEGASERLRWVVNKPIGQQLLREKVDLCLRESGQIRLIYQFNLPGEESADFDEFEDDVRHWRATHTKGQLALTWIPNQPSAHTPFQWLVPRYSLETQARLTDLRASLIGSGKTGLGAFIPTPLGPQRWMAQVIAEWIPVTPAVADATERLEKLPKMEVPAMVEALDSLGVKLPPAFLSRDRDTVFPWANVITTGDDPDKWRRFAQMQRKLAGERFVASSAAPEAA